MSNPQQPELGRSRRTPTQDPDAAATVIEAQRPPQTTGPAGPVPEDNQPGHHPPQEQDKPDLDAFAAKLGIPDETGTVPEAPTPERGTTLAPAGARRRAPVLAVAAVAAGIVATVVLVRRRRGARWARLRR